ncbi:MAG TPA: sulfotransferase [Gammaproteobacteria bacterium]
MRVLFICSAGHSGSTLLDLLLGSHPQAVSLGEITHLPKNLALNTACTCGSPARECPVWSRVVDELSEQPEFRRVHVDPYVLHLGMIQASSVVDRRHQTLLRMWQRKLVYGLAFARFRWNVPVPAAWLGPLTRGAKNKLVLFGVISRLLSRSVLVDSSKHYLEAVSLYAQAPDVVRIVLLVRDGRAVYYSGRKRGQSRKAALQAWKRPNERALPILARRVADEHLLRVRYEDLVAHPQEELERLCRFAGIDFAPEMLRFTEREHHVLNGNRMRFGTRAVIVPDHSWQHALSARELRDFDRRAGRLNRKLGYESTPPGPSRAPAAPSGNSRRRGAA